MIIATTKKQTIKRVMSLFLLNAHSKRPTLISSLHHFSETLYQYARFSICVPKEIFGSLLYPVTVRLTCPLTTGPRKFLIVYLCADRSKSFFEITTRKCKDSLQGGYGRKVFVDAHFFKKNAGLNRHIHS